MATVKKAPWSSTRRPTCMPWSTILSPTPIFALVPLHPRRQPYRDEVRATIEIVKGGVHKSFTTINRAQKHKMIDIRLLEGPFKRLEGYWRFEPLRADACKISPGHGIRILQSSVADRGRAGVQANRQLLGRRILPARNGTVWQTLSRS